VLLRGLALQEQKGNGPAEVAAGSDQRLDLLAGLVLVYALTEGEEGSL